MAEAVPRIARAHKANSKKANLKEAIVNVLRQHTLSCPPSSVISKTRSRRIFALVSAVMTQVLLKGKLSTRPDSKDRKSRLRYQGTEIAIKILLCSNNIVRVDAMHTTGCLCGEVRPTLEIAASDRLHVSWPDLHQKVDIKIK